VVRSDVRASRSTDAAWTDARARWPGVSLSDDDFAAYLAASFPVGRPRLDEARVQELFLACACVRRDPIAIAHFEKMFFGEVADLYRRFDYLPLSVDDVRQRLRERLYLCETPSLRGYQGRGGLRAWFRAAALHLLVNIASRETRERPSDREFFDVVLDASADAEAEYLKQACKLEFEQAMGAAIGKLTARERSVLRYAYIDNRSIDQIAGVFRVHRSHAARLVTKARDRLVEITREELMARLGVNDQDAQSIVRAALSRMGTTLLRRLG
jgi:RNA polymerase sigma-70 factor, ECF subfamily